MPGNQNRSVRWAFWIAAVILMAVGVAVVASARRSVADSAWVAHTHAVLGQIDRATALRREAISAQRGYLLTHRAADRDEFWRARADVALELRELQLMVRDNPRQLASIGKLEPLVTRRLALASRTIDVFEADGMPAAQAYIRSNGSSELEARINAQVADLEAHERQLMTLRREASDRSANLLLLAAAIGIPLSLGILVGVYRLLARENTERRRSEVVANAANVELGLSVARLRQLSGEMEGLSRYAGMLQGCTGLEELMSVSRAAMQGLLPGSAATVFLIRPSRDQAEVATTWGTHAVPSDLHPAPADCWSVRRNQPFACANVARDVRCAHVDTPGLAGGGATQCLPLSAQGELMGWLYFSAASAQALPDAALALQAAEQFSLALANLRLKESLRQQSIRDPLTGLFNRRYLEESLAREVARCVRRSLPLVVLMLDLDHFKAFNDRHGHAGGDALLTAFARLLQASCREEDIPCRFGGEEFTLILPEADEALAVARARPLLQDTARLVVDHQGEHLTRVTASIGIAALPTHGNSAGALMAAADAALYQAKARGRNQAVVAASTS